MPSVAFLPPTPLIPPIPSYLPSLKLPNRPLPTLHQTTRSTIPSPESKSSPLPTYAPCIPSQASEISDPSAQSLLRRVQYTSIQTTLPQPIIHTSHVISTPPTTPPSAITPLLFLHGFDSSILEFRFVLPLFDSHPTIRAYFLDILGWGFTEKPSIPTFSYTPVSKRAHILAYHDQIMGAEPMVLVGSSIGGAAAIDFALAYPERVRKLVLIDAQAFAEKPASPFFQTFKGLAGIGAEVLRSRWLRNMAINMSYVDDGFKCEDVLRIQGLHCLTEGWKEAAIRFIAGEGYCLSGSVGNILCECLVIWGEEDKILPKSDREKFAEVIDKCRVVTVDGCGHSPHIEKPDIVMNMIAEFVGGS